MEEAEKSFERDMMIPRKIDIDTSQRSADTNPNIPCSMSRAVLLASARLTGARDISSVADSSKCF